LYAGRARRRHAIRLVRQALRFDKPDRWAWIIGLVARYETLA